MTFAAYYYDDQFFLQQIKVAGLELDKIENYYTEERRIAYNNTNPEIELDETVTDAPPFVIYHLYSGISQSSVLGSLLFSIYVKDIPYVVDSQTLMFADDTKILRQIQSQMDFHQFQQDINNLFAWSVKWQLKFNVSKCFIFHLGPDYPFGNYIQRRSSLSMVGKATSKKKESLKIR